MDESNILPIADYPILFKNLKAVDRGDGTFAVTTFYDGTLRHLAKGNARALGSFEDDAMQKHTHNNTHGHTANPHDHDMSHQHNYTVRKELARACNGGWDASFTYKNNAWFDDTTIATTGGRNRTDAQTVTINNTTITTDSGDGKQAEETRMKNTAGQWYILAKVLI